MDNEIEGQNWQKSLEPKRLKKDRRFITDALDSRTGFEQKLDQLHETGDSIKALRVQSRACKSCSRTIQ